MDYVSCLVALGGDIGNTVPKCIPVSEVPVLQAIHGESAVFDVEPADAPAGAEDLDNRSELIRLASVYGHARDADGDQILGQVYPGRGAQVLTSLDQIGLADEAFKATARATPKVKAKSKAKAKATTDESDAGAEEGVLS